MPDDRGKMVEYLSCPMRFIPASVHDYLRRRKYLDDHPHTAKPYDELGQRWLEFDDYYAARVAEYQELVEKNAG